MGQWTVEAYVGGDTGEYLRENAVRQMRTVRGFAAQNTAAFHVTPVSALNDKTCKHEQFSDCNI